jgi:hypothetical protein
MIPSSDPSILLFNFSDAVAAQRIQRDSSPWKWGLRRGTPVATRGVLEILAAKKWSQRCIGNVAKWEYFFRDDFHLFDNTVW